MQTKLFSLKNPLGTMDVYGWQTKPGNIVSVFGALEGSGQAPAWQDLSQAVSQGIIDGTAGLMQEAYDLMHA